jgi:hypothetical protein
VTGTLTLGQYPVNPPVVLAPMAGITNVGFRQLCREQGAGIYVCEMITIMFCLVSVCKSYGVRFAELAFRSPVGADA